jgi:antirestriction protein ArdC
LERELGRLESRLELTERAESTLREQLERERERAELERQRAERLVAELEEARRPWWRKMFGR